MLDRLTDYADCLADPARWAIATIVEVSGSVPRPAGTSMAVRDDGRTIGSVSGGCVEGAVVVAAIECLTSGEVELHSFGYADDDGISVGLMCGGDVRVLVQPLRALGDTALGRLTPLSDGHGVESASAQGDPPARSTPHGADGGPTIHLVRELPLDDAARNGGVLTLGRTLEAGSPAPARVLLPADVDRAGEDRRILAAIDAGGAHVLELTDRSLPGCPVVRRVLVESTATAPRLLIYGANDFSAALAQAAAMLGRRVTVCDARPVFATTARHPGAHEVVLAHPAEHFAAESDAGRIDPRTAVVVLTHDPRVDLPVLDRALRANLAYVGAMGSRVTHEKRMQELRAGGLSKEHLARLHSPIGLDIGARTPAEVAVSILAELILAETAARIGIVPGQCRLRDTTGDVHDVSRIPHTGRVCAADPRTEEAIAWM